MPGRRNPLGLSRFAEIVQQATPKTYQGAVAQLIIQTNNNIPYVDLEIQFIGARHLPRLDVIGSCDPYFVANIDGKISFVSTVRPNTLSPVWNDLWRVTNVPLSAELIVDFFDKDEGRPHDDYIGKFKVGVCAGPREVEIRHPLFPRPRGTFWVNIISTPSRCCETTGISQMPSHTYLFDGPIRYSCHMSPAIGRLTALNDARLYYTWKIFLRGVPLFFQSQDQEWNKSYKAAQSIFGPGGTAMRRAIQAGHKMLYARTAKDGGGVIESREDVMKILRGGADGDQGRNRAGISGERRWSLAISGKAVISSPTGDSQDRLGRKKRGRGSLDSTDGVGKSIFSDRIKPTVYTYIVSAQDDSFRFSETGAAFFVDFASKHAQHSNCAPTVRYSGEFHPRPKGGWESFSDEVRDEEVEWELVFDNNSGTYAPDKGLLDQLKALLEHNFHGLIIYVFDREDEELARSREACREYGVKRRGMKRDNLNLKPNVHGETE